MGQPRRRGYPHGHHHRCHRRIVLPAAALALLFLAVSLLSVSFLSAPPLTDPRTSLATSSSRRFLRRYPTNGSGGEFEGFESGEAFPVTVITLLCFDQMQTHGWIRQDNLWHSKLASNFYECSNSSSKYLDSSVTAQPERYLIVVTSGGLNQQRTGIVDAVVAARILNATLVVPKLDQTSFWKDSSNFSEIFDMDWFISFLAKDVKIIKEPPEKGGKPMKPYKMRVPRKCTPRCYLNRVLPALLTKHVSCGTYGLDFFFFSDGRFEPDMLAFSGCYYGGGEKERRELAAIRRRWRTLHVRAIRDPEKGRRQGRCPLTPEEVQIIQKGYMGEPMEISPGRGEFHANPAACICEKTGKNSVAVKSISRSNQELVNDTGIKKAVGRPPYPVYTDEEADGSDTEDDTTARGEMIDAEPDDDSVVRQEDPELEEILSD
nr:unnamed protein product [Digitaria exilis]